MVNGVNRQGSTAAALALAALTLVLGLFAPGCGSSGDEDAAPGGPLVGLVFDVGGRGDKSFNDSAYRGLLRARDSLGVTLELTEPHDGSERESGLRLLASGDAELIVGVGFLFSDDIRQVALEFPQKNFACIDYSLKEGEELPPNLRAIRFREEQGSFLVGALAALKSDTGTVGFVGGMDMPQGKTSTYW
jgi:basic membrane protein A